MPLLLFTALFPILSSAKVDVQATEERQQEAQYKAMVASQYSKADRPSFAWGGCLQALGFVGYGVVPGIVVQGLDTFRNRTSEKGWLRAYFPGGNAFHTLGVAGPIEIESWDGAIVQGMGRLSLGAPPIGGKYLPGFAFVAYEQGKNPVGVHAIHSLTPQPELAFFARTFSNQPEVHGLLLGAIRAGLSLLIRSPLHLDSRRFIERLARAGADMSRFQQAQYLVLRAPEALQKDERFLRGDWVEEFLNLEKLPDRVLLEVYAGVDGTEIPIGKIRVKDPNHTPFLASRYGNFKFHVPHMTRSP